MTRKTVFRPGDRVRVHVPLRPPRLGVVVAVFRDGLDVHLIDPPEAGWVHPSQVDHEADPPRQTTGGDDV